MRHVPPRLLQRIEQRQPLGVFKRMLRRLFDRRHYRPRLPDHHRQILQTNPPALAQCRQRTQHIAQLPYVARPGESQQSLPRRPVEQHRFSVRLLGQ
ncbi:hypothetical protein D3C80_1914450 [compost metagenome]